MTDTPVLVLCHTVFNDVFRNYEEPTPHQESAKFLIRYIIEKQANLTDGYRIPFTSEQVKDSIWGKLPYNQGHSDLPAQLAIVLENLICSVKPPVENLDESVIIIADILSSRVEDVILVTNMPKKKEHVLAFYQKSEKTSKRWKEKDIPFKIATTTELKKMLREKDPDTCNAVDDRLTAITETTAEPA
jgi:hypothetical protein